MHVRRGDKSWEVKGDFSFELYEKVVRRLWPNIRHVFLMSDDEAVIAAATAPRKSTNGTAAGQPPLHYHHTRWTRDAGSTPHAHMGSDPAAAVHALLADVAVAANAYGFVGTHTSNLGRLVTLLSLGRHGRLHEYASFDDFEFKIGRKWYGGWSSLCRTADFRKLTEASFGQPQGRWEMGPKLAVRYGVRGRSQSQG